MDSNCLLTCGLIRAYVCCSKTLELWCGDRTGTAEVSAGRIVTLNTNEYTISTRKGSYIPW